MTELDEEKFLARRFEAERERLRGVAYRMLGSLSEADDAVQEAWLHVARAGAGGVENLGGWLTTVVARVCLDMLRARKARREEPEAAAPEAAKSGDPEKEALLADSVGLALLVVLDTLAPAERIAFVLHDLFGWSFDEVADAVGRTPEAARQLASRARRRVQGGSVGPGRERQREIVGAFLGALRAADSEAIVALLDPDVVVHAEGRTIRGARAWAKGAVSFSRLAGEVAPALVDGALGLVHAPRGKLLRALRFRFDGERIVEIDIVTDAAAVARLDVVPLDFQRGG